MRLHRLELTGFGPFRETQVVDFDAFERDGVFLISGRTGAGKSSILDGVAFALYGGVPRYEGGERRLRSDHSYLGDPTEVRLEFTVGGRRWRVTRAPDYERPAKRGGGLTTEPARAELDELVGGVWVGRAAKPRDVGLALDEVLGLNAQQFQQVILLAQNKFSRFLLARNDERQQLLRTLFGTRRFEQYKDELEQRRREAQKALDSSGDQVKTLLELAESTLVEPLRSLETDVDASTGATAGADASSHAGDSPEAAPPPADIAGRRDRLDRHVQRARYRVEQTAELKAQADSEAAASVARHAERAALARTIDDLAAARDRLARLDADAETVSHAEATLARARTAEGLRAPLEAVTRAEAAAAAATSVADAERSAWAEAVSDGADHSERRGDLDAVIDALTGDIARWSTTAQREHEAAEARAGADALAEAIVELASQLEALDAQRALIPAERDRIVAELDAVTAEAARADDLTQRRDELERRAKAAVEARTLVDDLRSAESDYARLSADSERATAVVTALLQRRLAGHAGELAADLVEGEPCAVCGSTRHPQPAAPTDDGVTDDDLAEAEAARDAAAEAARDAGATAGTVRAFHADAAARAGGDDADDLAARLDLAVAAARDAIAATARLDELTARRVEIDRLDAEAAGERDGLAARIADDRERLSALRAGIAALDAEVADARGDFASVAARLDDASRRRDLARAARAAEAARDEAGRALAAARADLDARVAASDFASAEEARAALVDTAEQRRLDTLVGEHRAAVEATKARLLELELAVAGGDGQRPDLEASQRQVDAAEAQRDAAAGAARDAHGALERLSDLIDRIDSALAGRADIAETAAVVTRLADSVAGRAPNTRKMDLETFVLAAELEEIVAAANLRLRDMSSGRYTLHHSDALQARGAASGLALDVLDAHTGRLRSPQSLSGGETFLASLALALGLAEVVTNRAGGLRLDTLFVDEGFGSLDPETLELAMRTLDELRAGGRTVGVISHVETMKEQLPAQVVVEATAEGPSVIRQDASA